MVTDVHTTLARTDTEWASGYRAGVDAAIAEIDRLWKPQMQGFNAPLITRVRERLQQLAERYPCNER